jgi:hypothetical protein
MDAVMAVRTKGKQLLFGVFTAVAAKPFVTDFQVRHGAAGLTTPAIATQNLLPQISRTTPDPTASAWVLGRLSS